MQLSSQIKALKMNDSILHLKSKRFWFFSDSGTLNQNCCLFQALYRNTLVDARWRDCVRYVQNTMENAVGSLYVKQTFAGESKRKVASSAHTRLSGDSKDCWTIHTLFVLW